MSFYLFICFLFFEKGKRTSIIINNNCLRDTLIGLSTDHIYHDVQVLNSNSFSQNFNVLNKIGTLISPQYPKLLVENHTL